MASSSGDGTGAGRYASFERLTFERPAPRVLEIVLNGVGRGNACDMQLHTEMSEVWKVVDADPDTNAAIVRGPGDAFCAGGHMDLVEDLGESFTQMTDGYRDARGIVYNMLNCSKPIVSAIRGPAAGAGLACAMLADITIAGRNARINDAHVKLGMVAGDHAVMIWPLLCGMAKAKYHLLLNDMISGEEAERIGLVSLCVDDDQVYDKAREIASRLADGSRLAISWTKYCLNNWLRLAGPSFDLSLAFASLTFMGPDIKEGIAAMREKRKPDFSSGRE
jgi:enoyl-CoA hydratase